MIFSTLLIAGSLTSVSAPIATEKTGETVNTRLKALNEGLSTEVLRAGLLKGQTDASTEYSAKVATALESYARLSNELLDFNLKPTLDAIRTHVGRCESLTVPSANRPRDHDPLLTILKGDAVKRTSLLADLDSSLMELKTKLLDTFTASDPKPSFLQVQATKREGEEEPVSSMALVDLLKQELRQRTTAHTKLTAAIKQVKAFKDTSKSKLDGIINTIAQLKENAVSEKDSLPKGSETDDIAATPNPQTWFSVVSQAMSSADSISTALQPAAEPFATEKGKIAGFVAQANEILSLVAATCANLQSETLLTPPPTPTPPQTAPTPLSEEPVSPPSSEQLSPPPSSPPSPTQAGVIRNSALASILATNPSWDHITTLCKKR